MPGSDGFLELPGRDAGLTHVLDKGLGPRATEDFLETAGEYVDIVKLGWGTAYVTPNLERKIEILRAFGKPFVVGGTFLEIVLARDKLDEYRRWLSQRGFTHVEVSDGALDIPRERKLDVISELARDFTVLSEVGSKDPAVDYAPADWVRWIGEELDAGAWKVIAEARESGTAGIFTARGEMRAGLVDEIAGTFDTSDLIFEAPTKTAQAWFVKHLGGDVNLGNIPPDEVIPLETLRLGLRADTVNDVLLREQQGATS